MRIAVIDGQGGGVGTALIEKLKGTNNTIIALGTNAIATSAMLRAGAAEGATGENAICYSVKYCDAIAGPIGILAANSLLGEVSPAIALAISSADAPKVLIPSAKCNIILAGASQMSLAQYVDDAVKKLCELSK